MALPFFGVGIKFGHTDFFPPQSFSTFASSLTSPSQNHIHQVLICLSLLFFHWASPSQVVLVVKNPPTSVGDIRDAVQSLGWEDPLEEDMAVLL